MGLCWAVVAAAGVLPRRCGWPDRTDSKQVGEPDRIRLFAESFVGQGHRHRIRERGEIDRPNILEATAGHAARVAALPLTPDFLLLDA